MLVESRVRLWTAHCTLWTPSELGSSQKKDSGPQAWPVLFFAITIHHKPIQLNLVKRSCHRHTHVACVMHICNRVCVCMCIYICMYAHPAFVLVSCLLYAYAIKFRQTQSCNMLGSSAAWAAVQEAFAEPTRAFSPLPSDLHLALPCSSPHTRP